MPADRRVETHTMPLLSSLVSAAISTHRPPFLALIDSRSSRDAKSEQAVNQSDLRLEETPVTVLKATVTLLV